MSPAEENKPYPRLTRSELAVPATSERFLAKAAVSEADLVFLDLEDAVAPGRKEEAREAAIRALAELDWGDKTVAVRVNALDTPWAHGDLVALASRAPRLDCILLPKTDSALDVACADRLLTMIEREHGRARRIGLEALIETARGVAQVEEIAQASSRLEALVFCVGDYSMDMRTFDMVFGRPSPGYAVLTDPDDKGKRALHWNDQWHFAMARVANACRAYGLRPIDGPFTDYRDVEGYRASALRAASLGFEGKWTIHPSQIALANEAFAPTPTQVEWAKRIGQAMEQASAQGRGAVGSDGILVDMAHVKLARLILDRDRLSRRQASGQGRPPRHPT